MLVEICNIGSDKLHVYTTGTRPICKIWEQDFFELLPEKEFNKAQAGKVKFNVSKTQLLKKSIKNY